MHRCVASFVILFGLAVAHAQSQEDAAPVSRREAVSLANEVPVLSMPDPAAPAIRRLKEGEAVFIADQSTVTSRVGNMESPWFAISQSTLPVGWVLGAHLAPRRDPEEERFFKSFPQAKREGFRLTITAGGRMFSFTDDYSDGDRCQVHRLVGVVATAHGRKDFLVRTGYYEGEAFHLVTDKGQFSFAGLPRISPDRRSYLMSSLDIEAGYSPNQLKVIDAGDYSEKVSVDFAEGSGPSRAEWVGSEAVAYVEESWAGQATTRAAFKIVRSGKKWGKPIPCPDCFK